MKHTKCAVRTPIDSRGVGAAIVATGLIVALLFFFSSSPL